MAPEPESQPAPPPKPRPIIVVKKKAGGHGGHHGGAWKVAYADFVTAMMALFIVLWLMSADKEVQQAVTAFFNNPSGPGKMMGTAAAGLGNAIEVPKEDMGKLREKIEQALKTLPDFRNLKDHVEMTITSDGLRIEMLETESGMFFESGKAVPTDSGSELLQRLADELGKLQNDVLIEGHTDAKPFSREDGYSNWELSTDRANAARRYMVAHGLRTGQVTQVRGYADRQLRHPDDPNGASNRRISVIVQYVAQPAAPEKEGSKKEGAPEEKGAEAKEEKPAAEKPTAEEKAEAGKKDTSKEKEAHKANHH